MLLPLSNFQGLRTSKVLEEVPQLRSWMGSSDPGSSTRPHLRNWMFPCRTREAIALCLGLCRQSELRPTAWSPAGPPGKAQTKSTRRFCNSARAWPPDLHAQQASTDMPKKQPVHALQAYDTNTDISHVRGANFWKARQGPPYSDPEPTLRSNRRRPAEQRWASAPRDLASPL